MYVMIDGEIVKSELAHLPVSDRGITHGEGLATSVRIYSSRPLRLDRHVDMLSDALARPEINMSYAINREKLARNIGALCAKNSLYDCTAHIRITPGCPEGEEVSLLHPPTAHLVITLHHLPEKLIQMQEEGINLWNSSAKKIKGDYWNRFKLACRMPDIIARREAVLKGCDDGLVFDNCGNVLNSYYANIFAVVDNSLVTPHSEKDGVVAGVMRELVIECAAREGIMVYQESLAPEKLANASEIFITGSSIEIIPARKAGERGFNEFSMAKRLGSAAYEKITAELPPL